MSSWAFLLLGSPMLIAYGLVALAGLAIVLFPMGPLTRDEGLE